MNIIKNNITDPVNLSEKFHGKYRIKTTWLKNWDYGSDGFYFVTICTKDRIPVFGQIKNNEIILSEIGNIAEKYWLEIPAHFPFVNLDTFVIMPNHIHGIIIINNNVETGQCPVSTVGKNHTKNSNTLSSIIGSYKSICTKRINKMQNRINFRWQSRFYDHIIRNEKSLYNIRNYIINNPASWNKDRENPNYL